MQLWKKVYLLTFTVFILVLNVCMIILVSMSFRNDLENGIVTAYNEEVTALWSIISIYELEEPKEKLLYFVNNYKRNNIYLSISENTTEIVNVLPSGIPKNINNKYQIIESDKKKYFCMLGKIKYSDNIDTDIDIDIDTIFLKDINYIYQNQKQRLITVIILSLSLEMFVGCLLYVAFKKIYSPVNNITHELRTPLTNIHGYAQYLMNGKLTEEDRLFANDYILRETENMKEIVEKLLMLGNLDLKGIKKNKIDVEKLLKEIQKQYPKIQIKNKMAYIMGDEVLVKSLIQNLIENALRIADIVAITTEDNKIMVANDGEVIGGSKLKILNKNNSLPKEYIFGNGYGISLCHEIVRLHKGKLLFESSVDTGTLVTITLPAKIVTAKKQGNRTATISER